MPRDRLLSVGVTVPPHPQNFVMSLKLRRGIIKVSFILPLPLHTSLSSCTPAGEEDFFYLYSLYIHWNSGPHLSFRFLPAHAPPSHLHFARTITTRCLRPCRLARVVPLAQQTSTITPKSHTLSVSPSLEAWWYWRVHANTPGANSLDVASAGRVTDFVKSNGGHTVITKVSSRLVGEMSQH